MTLEAALAAATGHRLFAVTQLRVLLHIARRESPQMTVIASDLKLPAATVCGTVDALAAAGLVERHQAVSDRRLIFASLTPAGTEAVEEILGRSTVATASPPPAVPAASSRG